MAPTAAVAEKTSEQEQTGFQPFEAQAELQQTPNPLTLTLTLLHRRPKPHHNHHSHWIAPTTSVPTN